LKRFSHVNASKASLRASVKFDVTDLRVQSLIFCHFLVSVQIDGLKPLAPSLGFRELNEGSSKTFAVMRWVYSYVFEKKSFFGNCKNKNPSDLSAALRNADSTLPGLPLRNPQSWDSAICRCAQRSAGTQHGPTPPLLQHLARWPVETNIAVIDRAPASVVV
jgi:hypothetical protein